MTNKSPKIILSRYFDENVKLVANMCSRCYEEFIDVKIIGVNLNFLKQINKHLNELNIVEPQIKHVNNSAVKNLDENEKSRFGFSDEEIMFSLCKSEKLNQIVSTREKIIDKLQSEIIKNNFSKNFSFKGFHSEEVMESNNEHKKAIKGAERIRYKIYERISSRVLKNICRTAISKSGLKESRKKIKKKEKCLKDVSKYFEKEPKLEGGQSKYFSLKISSAGKSTTISVKQEETVESNLKAEPCDSSNICTETCTNHIKTESNSIDYEPEYFKTLRYSQLPFDAKIKVEAKNPFIPKIEDFENGNIYKTIPIWVPPKSPHNLIEEVLYHDPWALLVATIFLNRTTCMCARPYVFWFLKENPDPLKVLDKDPGELEKYFVNLGLQRTRSVQVWRMSHDFVHKNWKNVRELYGIGKYGENAFKMFCLGDFNVEPKDRFLRIYKAWYEKVECKKGGNFEEKCLRY